MWVRAREEPQPMKGVSQKEHTLLALMIFKKGRYSARGVGFSFARVAGQDSWDDHDGQARNYDSTTPPPPTTTTTTTHTQTDG